MTQDAVAAEAEVEHREVARLGVGEQRAGQLVCPAVLAVGGRAAAVRDGVAEHGDGGAGAQRHHVDGADGVPVVRLRHGFGEVRRVACGNVGRGAGARVAGQARRGNLAVMDGDGEVLARFQREVHRVGDDLLAGRHREGARAAEGQLHRGAVHDLGARAHRRGAGDLHAEDLGLVLIEQVGQVQAQGLAANRHLDGLAEGIVREAGCRRVVVRLGDLQGRGPGGGPVGSLGAGGETERRGHQKV